MFKKEKNKKMHSVPLREGVAWASHTGSPRCTPQVPAYGGKSDREPETRPETSPKGDETAAAHGLPPRGRTLQPYSTGIRSFASTAPHTSRDREPRHWWWPRINWAGDKVLTIAGSRSGHMA